ncbi:MAG TPA: tRNA 2-thiouridine(34) synthase MnmA [Chloroflexota bacterium]|nr:tRNA 2-thiouridine(34) synthase MnmA [Chloroflexota bacterium]
MSGGVDSSVAAALLKQQGYDLIGVTLNVWPEQSLVEADTRRSACCSLDAVDGARRVADLLDFPHYTLNFREIFDRNVIRDFVSEYAAGRTPNPCVRCNRFVKFEALLDKARSLGAEFLATGHYARIGRSSEGRYVLGRAVDDSKDQSYALYSLTQEQLAHTLFPLGGQTKKETRRIAAEMGLATADKPESQEICFVQDNDYTGFLRARDPSVVKPGPIKDRDGHVLGSHSGIAFYTVGQRKGLGIATGKPLYVVEIVPEENAIVVGELESVYSHGLVAGDLNWVSTAECQEPLRVEAKIRYRATAVPATACVVEVGRLRVEFDDPQRAVTPGQAVVLYNGDDVVVGGTILRRH